MADPDSTTNEELVLEPQDSGSRADQVLLFNRCFDKHVEEADLRWRYDGSPHGGAVSVLLRAPDGQPVCGFAYSPRRFVPFGREEDAALCGQQGDVMTDPDWRKRGIASRVAGWCEEETRRLGWPMNWGFPNRRSASVFLKLGWNNVGKIRPLTFFFSASREARRERFGEGRLAALTLPLAVRRAARRRRDAASRGARDLEVRALERFPEEVVELSRAVEARFALMARRDAAFLDWRYFRAPSGRHRPLGLFRDGRLAGYVVVQIPERSGGLGWVVDLLAPEEGDVAAALEAGLSELERAGALAARATAVDDSWWARCLLETGFLAPKPENHLFVYTFKLLDEHPVLEASRAAKDWYLCDGDRDDDPIG